MSWVVLFFMGTTGLSDILAGMCVWVSTASGVCLRVGCLADCRWQIPLIVAWKVKVLDGAVVMSRYVLLCRGDDISCARVVACSTFAPPCACQDSVPVKKTRSWKYAVGKSFATV